MMSNEAAEKLSEAINRLSSTMEQAFSINQGNRQLIIEDALAYRWYRNRGLFEQSTLVPIHTPQLISFESLRNIDTQVERLRANTAQFVQGYPANNVLMTGARGTGKSSLVRACLDAFQGEGLRLLEVEKQYLEDLPEIVGHIKSKKEKFLVFCDDLSFEEGEHSYKGLKTVLDGSAAGPSPNVLVYATSNRRHMVSERASDNWERTKDADGELHPGDSVEEKVSLSERFGLHLHFYGFSQDEYLKAVEQWLGSFEIDLNSDPEIRIAALQWALERGARSGRVASQFARDYVGRRNVSIFDNS